MSAGKQNDLVLLLFVHGCSHALQKCVIVVDSDQKEEGCLLLKSEDVLQAVAIQTANICNFSFCRFHVDDPVVAPSPEDDDRVILAVTSLVAAGRRWERALDILSLNL